MNRTHWCSATEQEDQLIADTKQKVRTVVATIVWLLVQQSVQSVSVTTKVVN